MKPRGANKEMKFKGMVYTDGVGVSVLKQNFDPGKKRGGGGGSSKKKEQAKDDNSVKYIESLIKEELLADVGKYVLVDLGRRDMLYCMHEDSTAENKMKYRYTRNQRNIQTKSRKFARLRENLKPEEVATGELSLSECDSASVILDKVIKYLKERAKVSQTLYNYYSNEDIPPGVRAANRPPFRKMKFSGIINRKKAGKCLVRDLRRKFGNSL